MTARSFGDIAGAFVQYRNPDREKLPRRNSYDVNDPRAQVFSKILDGTKAQGWAFIGAIRESVKALTIQHRAERYEGPDRLQRVDIFVIDALLSMLDFATGDLYPSYDTIARKAGVSRRATIDSISRLKSHRFLDWVRRTVVAETVGEAGPQREQTSNGYHFGCHRDMAPRVRETFRKALARNLRKLGGLAKAKIAPAKPQPREADPELEASLARLEAALNKEVERGRSASAENDLYPQVGV